MGELWQIAKRYVFESFTEGYTHIGHYGGSIPMNLMWTVMGLATRSASFLARAAQPLTLPNIGSIPDGVAS